MKLLVLCCLVAAAAAAPASVNPENVQILKYENDNIGTGGFRYQYELSDGSKAEAQGDLVNSGKEDAAVVIKGYYSYVGEDGVTYTVNYVANEEGYHPTIEQGPGGAVPAAIIASLAG